jgi:hypothetical protein
LDEAPTPFKVYADGYLLSVCTQKTRTSAQFYYIPWNIHFHLSPLKNQQVLWSQFENKLKSFINIFHYGSNLNDDGPVETKELPETRDEPDIGVTSFVCRSIAKALQPTTSVAHLKLDQNY